MVANCPLFYSDEDEVIELPPPKPEVVEVALPLSGTGEKGGGSIQPRSKRSDIYFEILLHMVKSCVVLTTILHSFVVPSSRKGPKGIEVRCVCVVNICLVGHSANVGEAIRAVLVR